MLTEYSHALLIASMRTSACNGLHRLQERCARWILTTTDRIDGNQFFITKEFLAQLMGTSRPMISVTVAVFEKAGILKVDGRRVTVADRKRLKAASCECYDVIRHHYLKVGKGNRWLNAISSRPESADSIPSSQRVFRGAMSFCWKARIGAGKTTMGVEIVYRGATQFDEPGIIVLFEVSPDRLVRDAACFGWDLRALEAQRKLKIIFTTRQVFRQELQQADSLLLEAAAEIGARRIYVDGVAGAASAAGGVERRDSFHVLAEGLQQENLTAVFAVEAGAIDRDRDITLPEESIADTVVRLRMEERFRATVRSIEIVKSRGHDFQMGRHTFRIVDGRGIEVYRRVQAPRRASREHAAAFDPTTRVSTGTPGLDAVVNGGYFLGSTTVVSGISGVGKSVMGLQYIAEGARRGERSLMLTLDEQVAAGHPQRQ